MKHCLIDRIWLLVTFDFCLVFPWPGCRTCHCSLSCLVSSIHCKQQLHQQCTWILSTKEKRKPIIKLHCKTMIILTTLHPNPNKWPATTIIATAANKIIINSIITTFSVMLVLLVLLIIIVVMILWSMTCSKMIFHQLCQYLNRDLRKQQTRWNPTIVVIQLNLDHHWHHQHLQFNLHL